MAPPRKAAASPPRRRTQAERTQETQAKLIDGAIEILKRKRYAGLRTADVADLAGVSKGAQTHHFPSKDKLVLQALEEVFIRTQQKAFRRIEQARSSPLQMLDLLVTDSREFFLGDDFLLSLDLMMADPDSELGAGVKQLAQRYRLPVEEAWLEVLVEAGHPRPQALDVVRLTYAIARGFAVRQLITSGRDPEMDRLLKRWKHMASAMLLLSGSPGTGPGIEVPGSLQAGSPAKSRQKK
jgi:AcrR family transcriptional regulator